MILHRFVVGPEKLRIPYEPTGTFAARLQPALEAFLERHGEYPNACHVSVRFPGTLPRSLALGDVSCAELLEFYRQTLLGEDEILIGVEIEMDLWEGNDGQFNERAVG